ncbi:c-type cytochrome, methanol metabolism-related [Ancylobacter sp. 6x-1]|uniref:C-type cytochrome, methanol metabolism-related n=2 Tax=Ancylobacter crimeensis TaxID=2579147 RepID=A0ABT0DCL4_9HYPH|nr:c-type cytochrome, methanol metabolism-related [Ancylobacter crimeensis]MCK0197692.1 c-type cytochrome, methanol metabolism-related [Ancylobacter crimeensis]
MITATVALLVLASAACAYADGSGDPKPTGSSDGEYQDASGNPTFNIGKDGTVDWYTQVGYLRYTANCMQCHGPDGLGSTYAPSLVDSLKSLSYSDFLNTVTNGKKNVDTSQDLVMPSFANDKNVMCYIDAIYVYLRARSDGALGRGRPANSEPKPKDYAAQENACMG